MREQMAKKSPPPPHGGLFIRRKRWLFTFILLVGLKIIKKSVDAANKASSSVVLKRTVRREK